MEEKSERANEKHVPLYHRLGMPDEEFRASCTEAIEYVLKYYKSLNGRQASPSVEPGFMKDLMPSQAPEEAENWQRVIKDFDEFVVTGITHWLSSRFFGYFTLSSSFPAILAEILISSCGTTGFSWVSSPAISELEPIVLDWLAKAIGLPDPFVHNGKGPGCGAVMGSASESTAMTLLAARSRTMRKLLAAHPESSQLELAEKLVAYGSEYAHSCFERAGLISLVNIRKVAVDDITFP